MIFDVLDDDLRDEVLDAESFADKHAHFGGRDVVSNELIHLSGTGESA